MMIVSLIDTSVLCNLLPVPGKDQDRTEVAKDFIRRRTSGEAFILPITTVIETGNHVAQLADGGLRRKTAQKLHTFLELIVSGNAPWRLHAYKWDEAFISSLLEGGGSGSSMVEPAVNEIGCGDLCIVVERDIYNERTGISQVQIWTLDAKLHAHN